MRRVPPSVIVREELDRLLAEGADQRTNIVSALVDKVTRLVVQQLLEAEQADYLGGRGRYERRASDQVGSRNGTSPVGFAPPRERSACACPRCAVRASPT